MAGDDSLPRTTANAMTVSSLCLGGDIPDSKATGKGEPLFRKCSLSMLLSPMAEDDTLAHPPSDRCRPVSVGESSSSPLTSPERFSNEVGDLGGKGESATRSSHVGESASPDHGDATMKRPRMAFDRSKTDVSNLIEQDSSNVTHFERDERRQEISPYRATGASKPVFDVNEGEDQEGQTGNNQKSEGKKDADWEGEVTRCPCGSAENFGFMICCEACSAWQHGKCMGFRRSSEAPEEYFCDMCRPDLVRTSSIAHPRHRERRLPKDTKGSEKQRDCMEALSLAVKPLELRKLFLADIRNGSGDDPPMASQRDAYIVRYSKLLRNSFAKERESIISGLVTLTKMPREEVGERVEECLRELRRGKAQARKSPVVSIESSMKKSRDRDIPEVAFSQDASPTARPKKRARGSEFGDSPEVDDRDAAMLSREERKNMQIMLQFQRMEERSKKRTDGVDPQSPEERLGSVSSSKRRGEVMTGMTIFNVPGKRENYLDLDQVQSDSGANSYGSDTEPVEEDLSGRAESSSMSGRRKMPLTACPQGIIYDKRGLPPRSPGPSVLKKLFNQGDNGWTASQNVTKKLSRKARLLMACTEKLLACLTEEDRASLPLRKKLTALPFPMSDVSASRDEGVDWPAKDLSMHCEDSPLPPTELRERRSLSPKRIIIPMISDTSSDGTDVKKPFDDATSIKLQQSHPTSTVVDDTRADGMEDVAFELAPAAQKDSDSGAVAGENKCSRERDMVSLRADDSWPVLLEPNTKRDLSVPVVVRKLDEANQKNTEISVKQPLHDKGGSPAVSGEARVVPPTVTADTSHKTESPDPSDPCSVEPEEGTIPDGDTETIAEVKTDWKQESTEDDALEAELNVTLGFRNQDDSQTSSDSNLLLTCARDVLHRRMRDYLIRMTGASSSDADERLESLCL